MPQIIGRYLRMDFRRSCRGAQAPPAAQAVVREHSAGTERHLHVTTGGLYEHGQPDRTVRVTDQRSFARTVIALSLAVIACCALTFTIMLLAGSPAVQPQRVLDQDALARAVLNNVNSADFAKPPTIDDVSCPASIPVEAGREFKCKVNGVRDGNSSGLAWVKVKIDDDQGDLSLG
ncbi:DUF4333 domain-containing protein [Streptomyces sp. IB2014 016-6]|nr:DUF4333 domain-containing protein [Streptomyces sp. IB2014 016-6]